MDTQGVRLRELHGHAGRETERAAWTRRASDRASCMDTQGVRLRELHGLKRVGMSGLHGHAGRETERAAWTRRASD
ncbi:hypothetical protein NDU88_013133 [Pleurodeles waltl]|uniref:Uncharacterized protein n=1 Tax=Pleurodeles waltl TaxID=8319 RepID=A0AAV7R5V9_PLEWA|nr:hypothetical protein NDU88_013133 [Pleurodeles waltl]